MFGGRRPASGARYRDHGLGHGGADLDHGAAEMGGEHDVGGCGQRRRDIRLVLEHVGGPAPAIRRAGRSAAVRHHGEDSVPGAV